MLTGLKYTNSKSKKDAAALYEGNASKDLSADNMKKTRLHGYVYDFSVDIYVDYILYIHKHLIKNTKKMFGFHKNMYWIIKRWHNKTF